MLTQHAKDKLSIAYRQASGDHVLLFWMYVITAVLYTLIQCAMILSRRTDREEV